MDLTNYEDIIALVRKLCRGMSPEDQQDLVQDVCLKLLASNSMPSDARVSKSLIRKVIKQIKLNKARSERRKPLIYNNELVEGYSDETKD